MTGDDDDPQEGMFYAALSKILTLTTVLLCLLLAIVALRILHELFYGVFI